MTHLISELGFGVFRVGGSGRVHGYRSILPPLDNQWATTKKLSTLEFHVICLSFTLEDCELM